MSNRRAFVGGNWKMNGDLASSVELAEGVVAGLAEAEATGPSGAEVVVFPPYPYLQAVGRSLGHHAVGLGAQDVSPEASGAWTGQVSASMIQDLGARWVIIGHSERRHGRSPHEVTGRCLSLTSNGNILHGIVLLSELAGLFVRELVIQSQSEQFG